MMKLNYKQICMIGALLCSCLSPKSAIADANSNDPSQVIVEIWPGEGVPAFVTTKNRLKIYEQPNPKDNKTKTIKVRRKQRINALAHRLYVHKPSIIKLSDRSKLEFFCFGTSNQLTADQYYSSGKLKTFQSGSSLVAHYLMYRAEGQHLVLINNEICQAEETIFSPPLPEQQYEWWIKVEVSPKETGWALVGQDLIETKRRF